MENNNFGGSPISIPNFGTVATPNPQSNAPAPAPNAPVANAPVPDPFVNQLTGQPLNLNATTPTQAFNPSVPTPSNPTPAPAFNPAPAPVAPAPNQIQPQPFIPQTPAFNNPVPSFTPAPAPSISVSTPQVPPAFTSVASPTPSTAPITNYYTATFDDEVIGAQKPLFKITPSKKERIGIVHGALMYDYTHNVTSPDGKKYKYFKCLSEYDSQGNITRRAPCCDKWEISIRWGMPIVVYSTNVNGDFFDPNNIQFQVMGWIHSNGKHQQFIQQHKNFKDQWHNVEFILTCKSGQFQNIEIAPTFGCHWRTRQDLYDYVTKQVPDIMKDMQKIISKKGTIEEMMAVATGGAVMPQTADISSLGAAGANFNAAATNVINKIQTPQK